ncbi:alpha/beta hydrolase [Pseudonocardia sp. 73-21]|jgi:pimeloyl-ACP methyl ester carboxylesterase|uniref:alpha/beta fold hydrolase n=1 Tax=Pseudonocardia sp. 73-21 TaxID=1895809 RepID=UPI00095F7278|nr:alpha/beta hydrolase [Pseudonocardia sp. 73-21]OJY39508.1 MAG: alpha/beta hydrolase [Pseudonocardia sp. 73-21]
MTLLPGVRSATADTDRLRMHYLESGRPDGTPLVLVHGNLSTGRFYEHLLPRIPDRFRVLAPDMRGFGDSERKSLDATRGLADWADDTAALLVALGIEAPPHLVGWSTAGAAIASFATRYPVASLTFLDPVSPFGFGAVHRDGSPVHDDHAGSGGGGANPALIAALTSGDDAPDNPFTARNVMRALYWSPDHQLPADREDVLVAEIHKTLIGDDGYPGDAASSTNWPGIAPGTRGILNALSPKYCRWDDIVDLDPKPPVLWTHGTADLIVSDASPLDFGVLGAAGVVPGWPGADVHPAQPQVTQIRDVLDRYAAAGGAVRVEMFEGSGHGPHVDAEDRWLAVLLDFLG